MVRTAKELVKAKRMLSTPNPKPSKMLKYDTEKLVLEFYDDDDDDEISRCMSGEKDFAFVKKHGKSVHRQKRSFLCNLNEEYSLFKHWYPNIKVGFSKFCEIRSRYIITAEACDSNACVCSTHQNVKLMLIGSKLKELTAASSTEITSYKMSHIIYNASLMECDL
jgi:hypothetical protein